MVSSMSKSNRKETGRFITKPTGGVFPLHEDVLKEEARAEYRQHMDTFFLRLAELNINIYIIEQVLAFPYDLLAEGRTDDGFFFPLLMKNTFEACTLMVAKVATDQGSEVYTLPRLRNMLLQMVKPEHQPEIQARLGGLRFDQKTRELLEKARKLRDTHIAHFVHAASQEHMTLSEIKALRDELNTLLQGLSFEAEFIMLPHSDGLFGPYTKNTPVRSIPPGLRRLGTNLAMLVKEGELLWTTPDHIWIRHCERLSKSSAGQIGHHQLCE
jgi:hypothetical protein